MAASIAQLFLYPIKGCRGIEVERATLADTGLEVDGIGDREWVVVDPTANSSASANCRKWRWSRRA